MVKILPIPAKVSVTLDNVDRHFWRPLHPWVALRLLWLHAIHCLHPPPLSPPPSSAFFLAADNPQLPRPFPHLHLFKEIKLKSSSIYPCNSNINKTTFFNLISLSFKKKIFFHHLWLAFFEKPNWIGNGNVWVKDFYEKISMIIP